MLYALVDCNNFYASCERAFNPQLENKPIVILSNNDGCIISRSNEAKKLNIPMGAPFYQWESFCKHHHVHVFSSNYELYGDMSKRVMDLLKEFDIGMEIYSIDEAFLHLEKNISFDHLVTLRNKIKRCTGIPISIGVGTTKTLAKAANYVAKTSIDNGVLFPDHKTVDYLADLSVGKVWGIGRKLAETLKQLHIETAMQLRAADPKMINQHCTVTVEKIVRELNGVPCLETQTNQPRKQIISSRSFGKRVTELSELEEAVSHYTTIAARKLRKQKCVASALYVFVQTNRHREHDPQYSNSFTFSFPSPTADTRYLIQIAKHCLGKIYRKNYTYNKAGIMLLDISNEKTRQYDLLMDVVDNKSERVMELMDKINKNLGKNTIFLAAEGIERRWLIKCDRRSPRYTTRWDELPLVF